MENMNILISGIILLIISFLISKNEFKNWNQLSQLDKFGAIRTPLLVFLVLFFILVLKILKK